MPWGAVALSVGVLAVLGAFLWWAAEAIDPPRLRDAELDQFETELNQLETGDRS